MLNYYELFGVSPSADTSEIKKIIHQQMRLWSHRTNAPQIERRQEAERMVRVLEEMEEILLDEAKRDVYDTELRSVITAQKAKAKEEIESEPALVNRTSANEATATVEKNEPKLSVGQIDEMVANGEAFLARGEYYQALNLAKEVSDQVKDRADVWALLGRSRLKVGELDEAISPLVKASDLDAQNAAYLFDLGLVFEQQKNQVRALEQFKSAHVLERENLAYKFKLGATYVAVQNLQAGLPLLEQCFQIAPENPTYQQVLAKAYIEVSQSTWVTIHADNSYLPSGVYPTQKSDVTAASSYLDRAERIPFQDQELRTVLQAKKEEVQKKKGRQFTGSWLMVVLSTIFLIITQIINPSLINAGLIGLPIFYVLSAYTPKYRLYRKAYKKRIPKTDFSYLFLNLKTRFGTAGAWLISAILLIIYFPITAFVMSIVIIYNFIKNFF